MPDVLGLRLVPHVWTARRLVGELEREAENPACRVVTNTPGLSSAKVERGSDLPTAAVGLWSNWDSASGNHGTSSESEVQPWRVFLFFLCPPPSIRQTKIF